MPEPHPSRPPHARREPRERRLHGEILVDDYAWLRDDDWQAVMRDPSALRADIRAHLEAENAWTATGLAGVSALRTTLVAEMRARIKEDDASVPAADGPYAYLVRYADGGEHPRICRQPRDAAPGAREEILLDGDALAAGQAYFHLGEAEHSPDHSRLAWSADVQGSERYTLRFKDLRTGAPLPEAIEGTTGAVVWFNDARTVLYTLLDDHHRPSRVMRHRLGTDPATDTLIYEEPDPGFFVGVDCTESRRFLVVHTHDHETSEAYLLDAQRPDSTPRLVARREPGVEYQLSHHGERLILLTNADGAEDFKLVEAPITHPYRSHWRDLADHVPGVLRVAHAVLARHLVVLEREEGLPRIVVTHLADGATHRVDFDEEAYSLGLVAGYEFDTDELRFTYSSPTTPTRTFDYHLETRARRLRKEQEVPSGHRPQDYLTRRLHAAAPDGEPVPITVLHRRDLPLDGEAPVLLYGYGAYGISIPAAFATARLSLVDRGFVYAIAHVRGGTERGRRWYREGRRLAKPNTFTDFIAAAEHLVAAGYTRPGRIACHGASAGGLLVGAVVNRRPDLFGAAVGEVPFVDILNTMCDPTLPLTPPEWPEWGNPLADPEAYRCIRAYAPCENIASDAYPPILATAGLTDPRVTYWEPAKWVARLREKKTDANPLYLYTNLEAGHGGASGRFERLRETALVYAFLLQVLGDDAPAADADPG